MKRIISIMKKELLRVVKNPRMLIALILPGLMIFVIYSLMGTVINDKTKSDEQKAQADTYLVYEINMPSELKDIIKNLNYDFEYTTITNEEIDEKAELVKNQKADVVLVFSSNFTTYNITHDIETPSVTVYYNPYNSKSAYAYSNILSPATNIYKDNIYKAKLWDTNLFTSIVNQEFDTKQASAELISTLVPMLLLIFLFTGCVAVTPESIAGEKERGTMATLLATPTKRSEIAIGKISALSILALVSGASSFIGLMLSLPKLIGTNAIFSIYSFSEILLLFLLIMSTVLVVVSMMSIISSFSKNVKEATMLITPLVLLGAVIGILNMLIGVPTNILYYFIPLYNTIASVTSILSFEITAVNLIVTVLANILYTIIFVLLITKIFDSEKIMFSK